MLSLNVVDRIQIWIRDKLAQNAKLTATVMRRLAHEIGVGDLSTIESGSSEHAQLTALLVQLWRNDFLESDAVKSLARAVRVPVPKDNWDYLRRELAT